MRARCAANDDPTPQACQDNGMPPKLPAFLLAACWISITGHIANAMNDLDAETEQVETVEGQPIDSGFVILNGQYVAPPYVVGRRGDELLVNGRVVQLESSSRRPKGRGMGGGPGFGAGSRRRRPEQADPAAMVEQRLRNDAFLLGIDGQTAGFVPTGQEIELLEVLLSDAGDEAKLQQLAEHEIRWIDSARWAGLIETFKPTDQLRKRVETLVAKRDRLIASVQKPASSSDWLTYAITVTAMVLGVVALGNLLTDRPTNAFRWHELDASGEGVPVAVRNVVLLVMLGSFDLVSTLIAKQAGGFWEINPLGERLIDNQTALIAFKITALVISATILLSLRRYRSSQIASWWMCFVCTILTFRWAMYNSLFLG